MERLTRRRERGKRKERKQCRHGGGFEHSMLALNHSPTETRGKEGGGWRDTHDLRQRERIDGTRENVF
jgi:hypothetical protein